MTFKEFRNALCILRSIDRHELEQAGVLQGGPLRDTRWLDFRHDPYEFLLRADDATTGKLWALMIERGVEPDLSGAWRGR